MNSADVLVDAFGRVQDAVHGAVEGLSPEQLAFRVDPQANSVAWLIWHLTRVQDDHVADVAGIPQVWTTKGWMERFGLPFTARTIGYGHTSDEVAKVRVESGDLLTGYYDDVHAQTIEYVGGLKADHLRRIVDERWDPPVSLRVRLVSVIEDDLQHVGQAAFVRGIVKRQER